MGYSQLIHSFAPHFCFSVFSQTSSQGSGTRWPTRASEPKWRADRPGSTPEEPSRTFTRGLTSGSLSPSIPPLETKLSGRLSPFLSLGSLWSGPMIYRRLPWRKRSIYRPGTLTLSQITQIHTSSRTLQGNSSPTPPVEKSGVSLKWRHIKMFLTSHILMTLLQRVMVSAVRSSVRLGTKQLVELLFSSQAIGHCKTTPTMEHGFLVQVKQKKNWKFSHIENSPMLPLWFHTVALK